MGFVNAFGVMGRALIGGALVSVAIGLAIAGEARTAWLIVALAIGTTGLTFAFIGSRLGQVSGVDKTLRASGVAGTATITSLRRTGVRINNAPVIEFELEVDTTAHAPYTAAIRQMVPEFGGSLAPGVVVGVLVDRSDPAHLAIDWSVAASTPTQAETPTPDPAASMIHDAAHMLRVGRPAKAIIISMSDAGDMSELGLVEIGSEGDDDRLFIVDMEVQQAGMSTYEVRVAHRVPERLLGKVGPRTRVKVAVDREDDRAVAIDWDSVGR